MGFERATLGASDTEGSTWEQNGHSSVGFDHTWVLASNQTKEKPSNKSPLEMTGVGGDVIFKASKGQQATVSLQAV